MYAFQRDHPSDKASDDMRDRDMWRVATVTGISGGHFTIQYDEEEGKPEESQVAAKRLRPRQKARQKAAEQVQITNLAFFSKPNKFLTGFIGVYLVEVLVD